MGSKQLTDIQRTLFTMQDIDYRSFHTKLIPTIEPERIIGIRTPKLRAFAKNISDSDDAAVFLQSLPHRYYEENNLHAFLIEYIKDYDECINAVNRYLPYVDNWATCDSMSPKVLRREPERLLDQIHSWLSSEHTYTIRFAIGMLMRYYLDETFKPEYLKLVADVLSDEYYVNMMRAWYFATALAKQYDCAVVYLEQHMLDDWTHSRTIQKAIESYRVSDEHKAYLRKLRNR